MALGITAWAAADLGASCPGVMVAEPVVAVVGVMVVLAGAVVSTVVVVPCFSAFEVPR
jgi:hypothetical protein